MTRRQRSPTKCGVRNGRFHFAAGQARLLRSGCNDLWLRPLLLVTAQQLQDFARCFLISLNFTSPRPDDGVPNNDLDMPASVTAPIWYVDHLQALDADHSRAGCIGNLQRVPEAS
jgi:hypothetical protein